MHVKPVTFSPVAMKTHVAKLTALVLASPKIQAFVAKLEAERKAALPAASLGKAARRPVVRARPVVKAADVAASLAGLEAVLVARLDGLLATRTAARDSYARKVAGAVDGVAAIRKDLSSIGERQADLRGLRIDFEKFTASLTSGTRDARPRRF